MSELTGDPYGYGAPAARPRRSVFASALGAVVAVAGIAGLALWAQGLLTRDPGEIPFLRAEGGPMKVAPEDPGGLELGGTERAVTRMLEGERGREVALAPAPEAPAEEDLPLPMLTEPAPGLGEADAAEAEAAAPEAEAAPGGADRSVIDAAVARVLGEAAEAAGAEEIAEAPAPAEIEDGSEIAPVSTPLAPPRPSAARVAAAAAPAAAETPAAAARAEAMAAGDVAVQLGAFNTPEIAEGQWRRQMDRNEDLLGRFAYTVTPVRSGGRTLWRLRAGPLPSMARAQELCEALKARGDACITARVR